MLALTLNENGKVLIGKKGEIVVKLLKVKGHQAVIGFSAAIDIPIYREEVIKKLADEIKNQEKQKNKNSTKN